ncbi:paraquat-inducible protein A [Cognatiyoonia sediminum]|uniref:Paraquat-inducible protein A n=1 Tax=Cognatiyoonia sediminum TaxID=1508389 RepID=A0A1M5MVY8_9RHOB|nr:paraquat-inducible protein A [Cognatiyoonia sediminum]SHG81494.1 paraquat-inducible protein A [Cognatiyoonia sediminum]
MSLPPLEDLVACSQCDTLHNAMTLSEGETAACRQCGTPLMTSRSSALARVLSLALTSVVLMIAAISFPFLDLDVQGRQSGTSVIGAVLAFQSSWGFPLAIAVAGFIIILPLTRLIALIYAIGPLTRGAKPRRYARQAFALAERLRPWSMVEIFMVGVTVALIKVAGLATVTIGPAFWAFAALVVITVLKDQLICRYSIWEELDTARA